MERSAAVEKERHLQEQLTEQVHFSSSFAFLYVMLMRLLSDCVHR